MIARGRAGAPRRTRAIAQARRATKRLRYQILHVAGQLTSHARQLTLHLPADWPWTGAILQAFQRRQAIPAHG
jgi:hypothetical protein